MQNLIPETPYRFVPPRLSRFWVWLLGTRLPGMLRKRYGVTEVEFRGVDRLRASLAAGHGVLVTPNHSRPADPFVAAALGLKSGRPIHVMATRHVFEESFVQGYLLPRIGSFSVNREETDFRALRTAETILAEARHPLVMFPEGIVSRTNDHLLAFQRGLALVARRAATRRRDGDGGQVVVHPVFFRYNHQGDVAAAASPVLDEIEERLGISGPANPDLRTRILGTGEAILAEKEQECFGGVKPGALAPRIAALMEEVLGRVEHRWVKLVRHQDAMARARIVRSAIVKRLYETRADSPERAAIWEDIGQLYLVQLLYCYPPGYLDEAVTTPDRLLEMVEHFEEDLTDVARPLPPMRVTAWVGEAIPVEPIRSRARPDPLIATVRERMHGLMNASEETSEPAPN